MKKTLCIFLIIVFALASSQAFCEEKKSRVKLGSIGQTLVDSYQIGVGDILEITTWKEPDFTRENVLVRTDGNISFPLLNDFPAAGLSPIELKYNIEAGLKSFVSNPVVTVHVTAPLSQKFYILGEVLKTGEYPLVKHLTVLQAFALAGGFTEWASKKEIILLRHEGGKDKIFRINYKDIAKGKDFSQNIKLQPDDTIIVP
jgi:polysaccharide export outer membrane protein